MSIVAIYSCLIVNTKTLCQMILVVGFFSVTLLSKSSFSNLSAETHGFPGAYLLQTGSIERGLKPRLKYIFCKH